MTDPETQELHWPVFLVTGPSGAGRSTAIHALEDDGFEAIDNLPLNLLPRLLGDEPLQRPLAVGIDARNRHFTTTGFLDMVEDIRREGRYAPQLLYIDASDSVLIRRFSETRRRHPLSPEDTPQIGILREFDLLAPIRARADILIDTSEMTPHQLRAEIKRLTSPITGQRLAITLQSFSFKRGLPRGADMVLDLRFLRNPYWSAMLRSRDGRDPEVATYIQADPRYDPFIEHVMALCQLLLPAYLDEGKAHFQLCLGCTGGRHRSVAAVEALAGRLGADGWTVRTQHRDMHREGRSEAGVGDGMREGS